MNTIKQLNNDDFKKIVRGSINDLCGGSICIGETNHDLKDYFLISKTLQDIITSIIVKDYQKDMIPLEEEQLQILFELCDEYRSDLRKGIANQSLNNNADTLVDFNWIVKLSVASSRVQDLGQVLLSLNLNVDSNDEQQINTELTICEVDQLINTLMVAQKKILCS